MGFVPSCLGHPLHSGTVPQSSTGAIKISTNSGIIGSQTPTGIELPNPKLRLYQNSLGDYAAYPIDVPVESKKAGKAPPASFYQRLTRRPWDISTQQFARQINKRFSIYSIYAFAFTFMVLPFIPKLNATTATPPKVGYGLTSHHNSMLPTPQESWAYAGNAKHAQ